MTGATASSSDKRRFSAEASRPNPHSRSRDTCAITTFVPIHDRSVMTIRSHEHRLTCDINQ